MKRLHVAGIAALLAVVFALSASACNFYFNYESISAPIGTYGEIGIRVQKTHGNCTLPSMDEYNIDSEGVQILGYTEWEDLGNGLYEIWIEVSLSETGNGWIRISKTCTKEGYEEKILPVSVLEAGAEDAWSLAWNGTYPYEEPVGALSAVGQPSVSAGTLSMAGISVAIPEGIMVPSSLPEEIRLFYAESDSGLVPLLIVGEGLFLRLDHLLS